MCEAVTVNGVGFRKVALTVFTEFIVTVQVFPETDVQPLQLSKVESSAFSFLQMVSRSLELRPLLKVKTKEYDKIQEELIKYKSVLLYY